MKNVLMNKTCFSMNIEYLKRDSVYGIKFYNCNKNPIKYLQGLLQQEIILSCSILEPPTCPKRIK